jgi:hypothetical protein
LGVKDIRGFGVTGYADYLTADVSYHANPISGKDIPEEFSDSLVTETCFLKILENGFYSLYDLVLSERIYLFMRYQDGAMSELVYRVRQKNDSLDEDQRYKKDLLRLFVEKDISNKYFNRIDRASYNESDISAIFRILNGNQAGAPYKSKSSAESGIPSLPPLTAPLPR